MTYLLDANTFIEAKNRYYGTDICPGFWKSLVLQHKVNRICSIDRIKEELTAHNDEIGLWIENRAPSSFFKKTEDQKVIAAFRDMVKWVYSEQQYSPIAQSEFSSVADGWLVAYAKVNQLTVVTHEVVAAEAKRKVPLPNVCAKFGVKYVNTFEMLRTLGERFICSSKVNRT